MKTEDIRSSVDSLVRQDASATKTEKLHRLHIMALLEISDRLKELVYEIKDTRLSTPRP